MAHDLITRLRAAVPPAAQLEPAPAGRRDAAVLVLVDPALPGLPLLFMLRSDRVTHHRSQIGFPGGSLEPGETPVQAALRETHEEMGIAPQDVEVIGQLSSRYVAVSGRRLTPVVGVARRVYAVHPDAFEVEEWFRVDLTTLLACAHRTEVMLHDGLEHTVHFYSVDRRVIWGATGAILHELLCLLGRND